MAKIIVAPLNWGLGHATRCIPIINALIQENFTPIIASDGAALQLLQNEFPDLKSYELPSYNIQYAKRGKYLKYSLFFQIPRILKTIKQEKEKIAEIVEFENISGIISDNRFGVRSNKVPCIYITHQIKVLSGITTFITTKLHQNIISKFNVCWIPDYEKSPGLAGKLSHIKSDCLKVKYVNPISRFSFKELNKKHDLLVLLSGPEPQRSILEKKLLNELKTYTKQVLFVRGIISDKQEIIKGENMILVNYMLQEELGTAINKSVLVLARSGYSTIMDLDRLNAKVFFIPTPGQFEQEYLAEFLEHKNIAPFASQNKFKIEMLEKSKNYKGFKKAKTSKTVKLVFDVFSE